MVYSSVERGQGCVFLITAYGSSCAHYSSKKACPVTSLGALELVRNPAEGLHRVPLFFSLRPLHKKAQEQGKLQPKVPLLWKMVFGVGKRSGMVVISALS